MTDRRYRGDILLILLTPILLLLAAWLILLGNLK